MSSKGTKLKKKMILSVEGEKTPSNNYPCKGFHLNIFQRDDDPNRVDFIYLTPEKYKTTASQLKTEDDVRAFFEILKKEGEEISSLYSKIQGIGLTALTTLLNHVIKKYI